jgi:putative effector of murein hydrolase
MQVVRRHAAEIVTAVVVSSLFSLFSTAAAGRLLGLIPSLTCSIIPRCVTVALALPIASLLEGLDSILAFLSIFLSPFTRMLIKFRISYNSQK